MELVEGLALFSIFLPRRTCAIGSITKPGTSLFDIRDSIRYVFYPKSALIQLKSPILGENVHDSVRYAC